MQDAGGGVQVLQDVYYVDHDVDRRVPLRGLGADGVDLRDRTALQDITPASSTPRTCFAVAAVSDRCACSGAAGQSVLVKTARRKSVV
ncbi:hypothetical protein ABIA35_009416 [Catenulispora sp. MAP12-49]|uniref:hypothetical protein n=1 Tax=unclassified Catenulispora TaxID=414885 RepID=UPI003515130A